MIDARGRSCPEPVIMIKKAMDTKENTYEMMVDSTVSVENVTRYARYNGYDTVVRQEGDTFMLKLTKKQ